MRPAHGVIGSSVVAGCLLLTGCTGSPRDDWQSTTVDAARAARAWADPWAAPVRADIPTARYGVDAVQRSAGERSYGTTLPSGQAAAAERTAAEGSGWRLNGSDCTHDEITAVFAKGEGVEEGIRATMRIVDGEVRVSVEVAHHADGSWPAPTQTDLACWDEEGAPGLPEALPDDPLPGAAGEPGPEDFSGWQRGDLSETDRATRDALRADPWFAGLGVELSEPRLEQGDQSRSAGAVLAERPGSIAEMLVSMDAWRLTWLSCGAGRPTEATLVLDTPGDPVTARLSEPSEAAAGEQPMVAIRVQPPVPEAPVADYVDGLAELEGPRCFDASGAEEQISEGVPAVNAEQLHPYLG